VIKIVLNLGILCSPLINYLDYTAYADQSTSDLAKLPVSSPSKIKKLPSGIKLPCYPVEYWKKLMTHYSNGEAYKYCINYIKDETSAMSERLKELGKALEETEEALIRVGCKCIESIPKLKTNLGDMEKAYAACSMEADIDASQNNTSKLKDTKLDKTSSFFITSLIEFKEFQGAAQEFKNQVSSMLTEVRALRKTHKQNAHNDSPAPASVSTSRILDDSKTAKKCLKTLDGSILDLLDISDNTLSNTLNIISALYELAAEERYIGDTKTRKNSLYHK
jgi:hypothetical protein